MKKILLIAASSDIGSKIYELLISKGYEVTATSRKNDDFFYLDVTSDDSFKELYTKISGMKFDCIINCAGVAISSPVELLKDLELDKQLQVCLYGLLRVLRNFTSLLNKGARVINISSMASFGIFPYISPYCIAKSSSDILLNAYEIETGIRTISIKPGVVGTSFWNYCVDVNKENFANYKGSYENVGKFLLENAKQNSEKGITPEKVAKCVLGAMEAKNPKHSYTVGLDAMNISLIRFLPRKILNPFIGFIMKQRAKRYNK